MKDTFDRHFLIPPPRIDVNRIAPVLEAIVTQIQARDECSRIKALQRAIDEYPQVYAEYLDAFARR